MSENLLPYATVSKFKIRFNFIKIAKFISLISIAIFGILVLLPSKTLELIGFGQANNLWQQTYIKYWHQYGLIATKGGLVESVSWLWGQSQFSFNYLSSPFFSWLVWSFTQASEFNIQYFSVFFGIILLLTIFLLGYKVKSWSFGILLAFLLLTIPVFQQWGRVISPLFLQLTLASWILLIFWHFYDKDVFIIYSNLNFWQKLKRIFIKNEAIVFWTAIFMLFAGLDNLVFIFFTALGIWLYLYYPKRVWYLGLVLIGILKILITRYYFSTLLIHNLNLNIWQYYWHELSLPFITFDYINDRNAYSFIKYVIDSLVQQLTWPLIFLAILSWGRTMFIWWKTNFFSRIEQFQIFFLIIFVILWLFYGKAFWNYPEYFIFLDIVFTIAAANFLLFVISILAKNIWQKILFTWGVLIFLNFLSLSNRINWILDKNLYSGFIVKQQISQNLPKHGNVILGFAIDKPRVQKFFTSDLNHHYLFIKPDQQFVKSLPGYDYKFNWLILKNDSELVDNLKTEYVYFTSGEFAYFSLQ